MMSATTMREVISWVLKPLAALRENLALRRAAPPLGGINITPFQNYPVSRSSHLSEISKHELVEPEH
jgi:hypothetical protein